MFVAFDTETTGLVPGVDRIVELAAVLFEADQVIDTWSALVDPGIPMPPDAAGVNGITDSMVKGKPGVGAVLPGFLSFLSRGSPVAHNAVFDVGFLCAEIEKMQEIEKGGLETPPGPVLDTRNLARRAFPGRYSYSLPNLARDFAFPCYEDSHRALTDAHQCRRLFMACLRALAPQRELSLQELGEMSGPLDFTRNAPRQPRTAVQLERARVEGREVEIEYRGGQGETTRRRIKPLSFTRAGSNIAVVAYCYLRKAERTFILESIASVRPAP